MVQKIQNMTTVRQSAGRVNSSPTRPILSLGDQVYERLHDAILSGTLTPGSRVIELNLAAEMGTSQGPVREALQRLEREGLVIRQARSSTFVTEVTIEEMRELFIARSTIEALAIQTIAASLSDDQLEALKVVLAEMQACGVRDDMIALVKWDRIFHSYVMEWSGRSTLYRAWQPLYSQIQRFVAQTNPKYFESVAAIADTHVPIISALANRNPIQAAEVMKQHIMLIWSRIDASTQQQLVAPVEARPGD